MQTAASISVTKTLEIHEGEIVWLSNGEYTFDTPPSNETSSDVNLKEWFDSIREQGLDMTCATHKEVVREDHKNDPNRFIEMQGAKTYQSRAILTRTTEGMRKNNALKNLFR